jgi:ATP synthase F1 complex assembly factor 2
VSPPGHPYHHHQNNTNTNSLNGKEEEVVESPISAGVDGTQSASGVNNTLPTVGASDWANMLLPRHNHHRRSNHPPPNNNEPPSSLSWHTITLDNRALRTPLGLPLTLPSHSLALAVASEWDSQSEYLRPAQMPLMTLCCTAIDQVASHPESHRNDILRYLANDTSCYWSDPNSGDRVLHRKQMRSWGGLHDSVSNSVLGLPRNSDVKPAFAIGDGEAILLSRRSSGSGSGGGGSSSSGLPHPPVLVTKATKWVHSLDAWMLSALFSACAESKSFFIGAALIHEAMNGGAGDGAGGEDENNNNHNYFLASTTTMEQRGGKSNNQHATTMTRDGKWAVEAARVEEEFNIECWGLVEGGHDYDRLNCSIQMHAASFLARTVASGG